ncbi:MAG: T9SS type A sorting domain-containing protein [Saprospiraceae bacterium]|nr:T9SS type A sorting domain-containing protein [Saprospiraceae bacterium]
MVYLQIILFLLVSVISYSQEFKSTIWLEDTNGRIDSVTIGYDPIASESIDEIFGAMNITNQPWTEFEVRASQIDVTEIINGVDVTNPRPIGELSRYQTKTEIIPKNCLSLIEVTNQAGYIPFITLFIATDTYPIKIKWNTIDFNNDCLSKSVISDWPISTWWDFPCCDNLEIGYTQFVSSNEITINNHIGMQVVNDNFDTLIMLNIALYDGLGTNTQNLEEEQVYNLYPNPSMGTFYLPRNAEIVRIFDNSGSSILYKNEKQKISIFREGIFFVQFKMKEKLITKRIMNYWR